MTPIQQQVIACLDKHNVNYVIAGGYPRDLHFGHTPKDMDIWVYPENDGLGDIFGHDLMMVNDQAAVDVVREVGERNFTTFHMYNNENPDDPNTQCIEYVLRNPEVDVILLNGHVTSALELVNRFDCSLNRFVMMNGSPYFLSEDGTYTTQPVTPYKQQHRTTEKREYKMMEKARLLTGVNLEVIV